MNLKGLRKILMISLVKQEAKKLKKLATKGELSKLDIKDLWSYGSQTCVYGQMTGSCFSDRANELIFNCAKRTYVDGDNLTETKLNEKPKPVIGFNRKEMYYSPIEVFIAYKANEDNGNNARLLEYLKGNTNKLKLI